MLPPPRRGRPRLLDRARSMTRREFGSLNRPVRSSGTRAGFGWIRSATSQRSGNWSAT